MAAEPGGHLDQGLEEVLTGAGSLGLGAGPKTGRRAMVESWTVGWESVPGLGKMTGAKSKETKVESGVTSEHCCMRHKIPPPK